MSAWNEDNFLEQMTPLLGTKSRASVCPAAENLSAVVDGTAGPALREAVTAHTAGCPACADLERRLRQFASATPAGPENEWRQTEQRLDSRMRVILGAGTLPARQAPWWDLRSWKMVWLAAPAAALGFATFIMLVRPVPNPVPVDTATATRATAPPAAAVENPAPGIATNFSAIKKSDPGVWQQPDAAPEVKPAPAIQAEAQRQSEPESGPVEVATQPPSAPDPAMPADAPATHASMRRAAGLVAVAGQAQDRPALPPANAPGSVRIDAGTRVWILLKSTSPQTNGDFKFRGMVLLPVTQAGGVLLDRETEVVGVGKVSQGRTTIRIVEFVWQGMRYKLRGAAGAMNVAGPGAGPAVEFNAGQVLETWLAAVSTYDRVTGEAAPPQG